MNVLGRQVIIGRIVQECVGWDDPGGASALKAQQYNHTHPEAVFIDTSVFVAKNFDFEGRLFKALVVRVEAGDVLLVMPEIMRREIHARIALSVHEAEKALVKFRKGARVLRLLPAHPLAAVFSELDWPAVRGEIERAFSAFLKRVRALILPIDGMDTARVFDDYFECRPPFGAAKKKSEFPDAFAVRALLRQAETANCPITVVSLDGDWRAACDLHEPLVYSDSLASVLDRSLATQPLSSVVIRDLLNHHRAALLNEVLESFRDRGFYWDNDEGLEGEVEEVFDEEITAAEWAVLDNNDEWAEITSDVEIAFRAHVCYPDPDMSAWDSEDETLISFGSETARLSASKTVTVSFRVNLERLRSGELKTDGLIVNDHADLWFDEVEVEDTWSSGRNH